MPSPGGKEVQEEASLAPPASGGHGSLSPRPLPLPPLCVLRLLLPCPAMLCKDSEGAGLTDVSRIVSLLGRQSAHKVGQDRSASGAVLLATSCSPSVSFWRLPGAVL